MLAHRVLTKIRHYHSVLGLPGVAAFLFAKLSGRKSVFKTKLAGLRHPVYVRIGTTDLSVLKQTLIERHYDFSLPATPKVIVDAGANIGLSAVFFANKYPDADIFAIEPDEGNFQVLERNVAPYPRVKALQAALWSENKQICLVDPGTGDHGFRTVEESSVNCQRRGFVKGLTLDALMNQMGLDHVDVLKIDIEGAEKEVFKASGTWIGGVGAVMAELHDDLKPGCRRAFCEATRDFPEESRKGETVMRSRSVTLSFPSSRAD